MFSIMYDLALVKGMLSNIFTMPFKSELCPQRIRVKPTSKLAVSIILSTRMI